MLYCEECRVESGWPEGLERSYGKCEYCGSNRVVCHDYPSGELPPVMKTSIKWYHQRDNKRVILLDPDGWDRKNFDHSWSEERVTKQEFERRLGLSTCLIVPIERK